MRKEEEGRERKKSKRNKKPGVVGEPVVSLPLSMSSRVDLI
jgi:hypothetical protein